ncbi:MAG: PRC-barrel domain-containing protein, partial [Candidatus Thermoplasmatota archaeon]|nr:PRC-barrel domain-containing protein [Candidatus Thermoplasmatota archaeon]
VFGKVETFLFDDISWMAVYLDIDIGGWLEEKQVLISPLAIKKESWEEKAMETNLTKEIIENAPDISSHEPLSRKKEREYLNYYSWPAYWQPVGMPQMEYMQSMSTGLPTEEETENVHLRSAKEVRGYKIHSTDKQFGHIDDLIVDDETWIIRYIVVDTRDFLPGKKVLISPNWIKKLSWDVQEIYVDLSEEAILGSPEYNPSEPVNRDCEDRLHDYYGRPKYYKIPDRDRKGKPKKI